MSADAPIGSPLGLDPRLVQILRCPSCRSEFATMTSAEFTCSGCSLVYPVREGIPILLIDEAKPSAASPAESHPSREA